MFWTQLKFDRTVKKASFISISGVFVVWKITKSEYHQELPHLHNPALGKRATEHRQSQDSKNAIKEKQSALSLSLSLFLSLSLSFFLSLSLSLSLSVRWFQ